MRFEKSIDTIKYNSKTKTLYYYILYIIYHITYNIYYTKYVRSTLTKSRI